MTVKTSAQDFNTSKPTPSAYALSKQQTSEPLTADHLIIGDSVYHLADHTPMMVQYLTMKANYPQALLLYRMGDFYELFFDDAKRAAQILDITLTRRGTDKAGNTIAMAGVPFHAADSYMARLIAAGQTVVVCEQIDESTTTNAGSGNNKSNVPAIGDKQKKDKSKSAAGSIMRREVVKTLTAGTITDDALIAPNHTPTVVAIDIANIKMPNSRQTLQAAISQMDLAAGTLTTQTVIADNNDLDNLQTQMLTVLARFAPSECIISEALASVGGTDAEWMLWLRQHLDCPIIEVAANDFHRVHASDTLCQQFEVQRLDGLGIADNILAQSSCAALIHYARQTQQRHVPQVNQLIVEYSDDYLVIDANSQQNLELFSPVSSNGTSLISVLNHCQTPMGKRLLVQQMKRPLRQHSRINMRLDAITCLLSPESDSIESNQDVKDSSLVTRLRETLNTIGDIERISSRIGLMSAKPRDLRKLADGIASSAQLTTLLTNSGISHEHAGLLTMLMQQLPDKLPAVQSVAELIERAIIVEPPAHIRDGGMLAAGYDAEFDRLTHLHDNIQVTLDEMVARARQDNQLPSLKVGFNKVSGFYFELPKMQAKNAPAHFIRRQTLKSSERFITDELKEVETEYLSAQTLALTREKQLYQELLTILSGYLADLQQLSAAIAQIDVLSNWAQLATTYHWQRPTMGEDSKTQNKSIVNNQTHIDIRQGRHVVVEAALNQANANNRNGAASSTNHFVANDCVLGSAHVDDAEKGHPERLLLITGPNMGGKSTYMRQTALIVLLAHCGSFVPAEHARIGDIDRIFTRIGSADDLAGGKSTFMVEMIETANILNQATNKSLVLMDEVGRGTATTDGLAIAHACVNRLLEIGCLTLFATHYFELTQLAAQNKGIRNLHVAASEIDGQLLLLHQIRDGAASSSFGLHVAKMAGIPPSVIDDAKRYLRDHPTMVANTQSVDDTQTVDDSQCVDDKSDLAKSRTDNCQLDDKRPLTTIEANPLSHEQAAADIPQQNQLFSLQDELAAINPDNLTPKQAHDLLYHLKDIISH